MSKGSYLPSRASILKCILSVGISVATAASAKSASLAEPIDLEWLLRASRASSILEGRSAISYPSAIEEPDFRRCSYGGDSLRDLTGLSTRPLDERVRHLRECARIERISQGEGGRDRRGSAP